jgi:Putative Ig domain
MYPIKHSTSIRTRLWILSALTSIALLSARAEAATALGITGSPDPSVVAAHYYYFQPSAHGPTGIRLTYSVSNKPSWAQFDSATGRLAGTPTPASVGTYANIVVSVSEGGQHASLPAFTVKVLALASKAPVISGTPATSVTALQSYSFQPTAMDPNGLRIVFGVWNKPTWLSFDATTGRLSGTAPSADVGVYSNIVITAYDGYSKAALPAFAITVKAPTASVPPPPPPPVVTSASVTVSWSPPTQNSDGSPLTNLAGYRVYYGTTAANLNSSVTLANPGLARDVIENLTPATWYFAMTAYNSGGLESARTGTESVVVN